ncbi:MAG: hypothetical protein ACLSH3_15760 [Alistipes finegoldii]
MNSVPHPAGTASTTGSPTAKGSDSLVTVTDYLEHRYGSGSPSWSST